MKQPIHAYSPGLSNWRPAGRIRPATPSNPARNHPPENVVHRPVNVPLYYARMPVMPTDDNTCIYYLLIFSVDLTYRVDVIPAVLDVTCALYFFPF